MINWGICFTHTWKYTARYLYLEFILCPVTFLIYNSKRLTPHNKPGGEIMPLPSTQLCQKESQHMLWLAMQSENGDKWLWSNAILKNCKNRRGNIRMKHPKVDFYSGPITSFNTQNIETPKGRYFFILILWLVLTHRTLKHPKVDILFWSYD